MTPLAAQIFRRGDQLIQEMLARCQFFECTRILDLSQEMAKADVEAGSSEYSLMAQLPAPYTGVEYLAHGLRVLLVCEQHDEEIRFVVWFSDLGRGPGMRFLSGMTLGTQQNTEVVWSTQPWEARQERVTDQQIMVARSFSLTLEKLLLIINQPGLVDHAERPTDKRVQRVANAMRDKPDVSRFFECRIRPGRHGEPSSESGIEMPLHYVRKHFKPSAGKWVDGYWRGNADLGLHLKWYSPAVPRKDRA